MLKHRGVQGKLHTPISAYSAQKRVDSSAHLLLFHTVGKPDFAFAETRQRLRSRNTGLRLQAIDELHARRVGAAADGTEHMVAEFIGARRRDDHGGRMVAALSAVALQHMVCNGRVGVHEIVMPAPDRTDRGACLPVITIAAGKLCLKLFQKRG